MKKGDTTTMNRLESRLLRGVMLLAILGILGTVLPVLGNWSVLQERDPEVRDYMSIAFTSKNNGWVVGAASFEDFENPGFIGYTMDGGKSWQNRKSKSLPI